MWSKAGGTRTRSLADISVEDEVRLRTICFDVIREHCSRAGLHAGDSVRCVHRRNRDLVLETAAGVRLKVDRFYACFVEVDPAPANAAPIEPRHE